jgi:hypothetical protein
MTPPSQSIQATVASLEGVKRAADGLIELLDPSVGVPPVVSPPGTKKQHDDSVHVVDQAALEAGVAEFLREVRAADAAVHEITVLEKGAPDQG